MPNPELFPVLKCAVWFFKIIIKFKDNESFCGSFVLLFSIYHKPILTIPEIITLICEIINITVGIIL